MAGKYGLELGRKCGRVPADIVNKESCYFHSIELINIRTFGEPGQTLLFAKPSGELAQWTLLLGDNGVGKTTILQCLADSCADATNKQSAYNDGGDLYLPRFARSEVTSESPSYSRRGSARSSMDIKTLKNVSLGTPLRGALERGISIFHAGYNGGEFVGCSLVPSGLASFHPCGYGAFRRFGTTKLGADLNPDPCASLFSEDEPLLNVEEWLLRADYAAAKSNDKMARRRRDLIIKLVTEFLPEVSDIRIKPSGHDVPTPEAKTPDGWVPVRALSVGYKATMAWVTDFAARMLDRHPESDGPFAEPAVVLVDQIDTHLHPKWQRQLIGDLTRTFPNTQFIVTAHSPLMVLAMPDANIALLRREGDHVTITSNPDDVRGWRVDQVLASELFDNQPSRDVVTQTNLETRRKLLLKEAPTAAERRKLNSLNQWAASIPTADTPDDIRAMELIRRAAKKLSKAGS